MEPRPPAVTCTGCERTWNSAAMAEGLRLLGSCPRCAGELSFADGEADAASPGRDAPGPGDARAPHLVLGIPRR